MATLLSCRRAWLLPSILLLAARVAAGEGDDQPAFTFHTGTNEVRLAFSATDQNGHAVADLQASDVVVVDRDMVVRQFQSFTRSDWNRLEIAVLADTSESVGSRFRQQVGEILTLISQSDAISDESFSIFSFHGSQPALVCSGDCRASHAAERLLQSPSGKFTPLFDTVTFAADFLARRGDLHTNKILIVLSDGADTISRSTLSDAVETAVKDDVEIYSVDLDASASSGAADLYRLSMASGGHYFPAPASAKSLLNTILENYRATYTVSYRLPSQIFGFHTVRILPTHNLNLQFRSRSGYYFPDSIR